MNNTIVGADLAKEVIPKSLHRELSESDPFLNREFSLAQLGIIDTNR